MEFALTLRPKRAITGLMVSYVYSIKQDWIRVHGKWDVGWGVGIAVAIAIFFREACSDGKKIVHAST